MSKRYTSSSIFSSVSLLIIAAMVILSSTSIDEVTTENHPVYEKNKMISKQFNDIRSSIKKKNNKKNKRSIVNCYLKWDYHAEEKSYLEKMHNEIIKMPVEETLESLHKFGHLGYLREEACDGQSCVMKYLFSEAWSEDNNNDSNDKKDGGYCKVSSDVLKARLPKVIKIIIQREKLENNKKNKNENKTTRLERQPQQQQKKKEDYSSRVKSLKDFVQL